MSRVRINPELIAWAMERVADKEGLLTRFPSLSAWLSGQKLPTMRQLEAFARATSIPFGFLLLDQPPDETTLVPLFRTISNEAASRPDASLLSCIITMQQRQEWMRGACIAAGCDPLSFVQSASLQSDPVQIAQHMQQTLNLSDDWSRSLPDQSSVRRCLIDAADAAGVVVVTDDMPGMAPYQPLDPTGFRGFALVDAYAPFVFLNAADDESSQIVALIHGLAHIWVGKNAAFDLNHMRPAPEWGEIVCFQAAAAFLLPASDIQTAWREVRHFDDPLGHLARTFKVHETFIAQRLVDLHVVEPQGIPLAQPSVSPRIQRRPQSSLNRMMDRLGKRFATMVVHATLSSDLLYHDAYTLTGIAGTDFDRLVSAIMHDTSPRRASIASQR